MSGPGDLTALIRRAQGGDAAAADALFAESYPALQRLARIRLSATAGPRRSIPVRSSTRSTCASWRRAGCGFEDRLHFQRWVGRAMRSVIVDLARRRLAERRGGGKDRIVLTTDLPVPATEGDDLVVRVHDALSAFPEGDARAAQVVELRFFAGMTEPEVAEALGVTDRTVRRDWEKARLLLSAMLA